MGPWHEKTFSFSRAKAPPTKRNDKGDGDENERKLEREIDGPLSSFTHPPLNRPKFSRGRNSSVLKINTSDSHKENFIFLRVNSILTRVSQLIDCETELLTLRIGFHL